MVKWRRRVIAGTGSWPLWRRLTGRPQLSSDHSLDFTAEDIINPWWGRTPLAPELVHLAAMLTGMTPERRQVLADSESGNGWPGWWRVRFYGEDAHWPDFKLTCQEVFDNLDSGIPAENTLLAIDLADNDE
jgi:hypothetical protein